MSIPNRRVIWIPHQFDRDNLSVTPEDRELCVDINTKKLTVPIIRDDTNNIAHTNFSVTGDDIYVKDSLVYVNTEKGQDIVVGSVGNDGIDFNLASYHVVNKPFIEGKTYYHDDETVELSADRRFNITGDIFTSDHSIASIEWCDDDTFTPNLVGMSYSKPFMGIVSPTKDIYCRCVDNFGNFSRWTNVRLTRTTETNIPTHKIAIQRNTNAGVTWNYSVGVTNQGTANIDVSVVSVNNVIQVRKTSPLNFTITIDMTDYELSKYRLLLGTIKVTVSNSLYSQSKYFDIFSD